MADATTTCREGRWFLYAGELEGVGQLCYIRSGDGDWQPLVDRKHFYISELRLMWYGPARPPEVVEKYYDEGGQVRQWSP